MIDTKMVNADGSRRAAPSLEIIGCLGLAPFNHKGKLNKMRELCAAGPLWGYPKMKALNAAPLKKGMGDSMTFPKEICDPAEDVTYKNTQDFMVPSSVGKPFKNAPGTFDPKMEGRTKEKQMGGLFVFDRMNMKEGVNAKGITYEKFVEHRGYAAPGYIPKHPKAGEPVKDGVILSIDAGGPSSTLM